jgi:hypothetical protein
MNFIEQVPAAEIWFQTYIWEITGKVVSVVNQVQRNGSVWGCRGIAPPFLTSAPDVG